VYPIIREFQNFSSDAFYSCRTNQTYMEKDKFGGDFRGKKKYRTGG
jgi:hypothetical protein